MNFYDTSRGQLVFNVLIFMMKPPSNCKMGITLIYAYDTTSSIIVFELIEYNHMQMIKPLI
jgi:hypothetical protein